MNRRKMLSAAPAVMLLASTATAGAAQLTERKAAPSFYSTLDPEQKAAFDKLRAIVKAQANGTWVEPPDPDAEVHARCAEFHRLHALGYTEDNPAWEAAMDARFEAYTELEGMVPVTHAGHRAKARVALVLLDENQYDEFSGNPDARFALITLRGLLGRGPA